MEDKYKPTQEFTDHAWSEMQALLDKEMPDKGAIIISSDQGKRKNLLLLLPLLLLLSIVALFFYYQSNPDLSNDSRAEGKETTELAIVSSEGAVDLIKAETSSAVVSSNVETAFVTENSANNKEEAKSIQKSGSAFVNNAITNSQSNIASSKSYRESLSSNTNNNNTKTSITTPAEEQNQAVISEKEVQITEEKQTISPFILEEEKYFNVENKNATEVQKEENPAVALLSPIDVKTPSLLDWIEEEQNIDDFLDVKNLKNKPALYAFGGVRNYDLASKIDFVGGIETVMRKTNKKLGLRTGVNYAQRSTIYLTREESIAQVSNDEDAIADFAFEGGGIAEYYDSRAALNTNPVKYHFLEVPLFLDYKLSKKWSLHSGIAAKTLLYSSIQDFGLLNGLGGRNNDMTALINNTPEGRSHISYFSPRKFNIGASLGVNFMATDRFGLQARFSRNLLDVYPDLPNKQRSNSFELGMSWRLK